MHCHTSQLCVCPKKKENSLNNYISSVIAKVPIPIAGVSLGVVSLGNLLPFLPIRITCAALGCFLIALLVGRMIAFPVSVAKDFRNSIFASVSGTFFMAIMQLATYLHPYSANAALVLWAGAIAGHIMLIFWFTFRYMRNLDLEEVFPTYFICYVGIIVASATSPVFGMQDMGMALFYFGFVCYIVLFVLITLRFFRHKVAEPAKPLFCIYTAPASLSIVGYLACSPEPNPLFVYLLLIFAQAFFVAVLVHLPKFIKGGFYPSYAAMTFPFVITATALSESLQFFRNLGYGIHAAFDVLMALECVFAVVMVAFVVFHYMRFLFAKAESRAAELAAQPE